MLSLVGLITASICASCAQQQQPVGPRLGVPEPTVDQQISDGCARFQVRFDAGGSPIIEPIYGAGFSSYCEMNELKLLSDTSGTFDPVTGALRLAVVMENMGSAAVIPRVKLRFNADSVIRLDSLGNPVSGTPDILGYQPDSASANGRNAYWFFDQSLAPSGQPQVLLPGARTQRRWLEFRGTGWTDRVRLKLFATGAEAAPVPAIAPDTLPPGVINSLPNVTDGANRTIKSQLVLVQFREGTAQPLREAAVNAVSGQVIGGIRVPNGEGLYYLRITTASTASALHAAASLLHALPQVAVVYLLDAIPPNLESYRRPDDGVGMQPADWSVNRQMSSGANWALERIEAPLAWGCATGATAVRVAVVDRFFNRLADLDSNIVFLGEPVPGTLGQYDHGTEVASVIGAMGSNGFGSTGVSWKVGLDLRNRAAMPPDYQQIYVPADNSPIPSDFLLQENIKAAARAGASIITLAINIRWRERGVTDPSMSDAAQKREILAKDSTISTALRHLALEQRYPLIVMAAGNDSVNASLAGYVGAKNAFPQQVLVVGALERTGSGWPLTNWGALIDLYAPGEFVATLNAVGTRQFSDGTSYASPLVAGAAALLLSFDPRLKSTDLKAILVGGAQDSISVNGVSGRILSAYGALKAAAQRPGAPLCGNRVWAANGALRVERSVANGVGIDESLATVPADARSHVNVFHGGKRIQNLNGTGWNSFLWSANGTWTAAANTFPDSGGGATWWSSFSLDHDLTKRVDAVVVPSGTTARVSVRMVLAPFNTATEIASIGPFPYGTDSTTRVCIMMDNGTCSTYRYKSYEVRATVGMSPQGDRAFVAVDRRSHSYSTPSSFTPCIGSVTETCTPYTDTYGHSAPSEVHEVNLVTNQILSRWTMTGAVLYLAASERNDELVTSEAVFVTQTFNEYGGTVWGPVGHTVVQDNCSIVFRDIRGPAVSGNVLRTLSVNPLNACALNYSKGGGTIAPRAGAPVVSTGSAHSGH